MFTVCSKCNLRLTVTASDLRAAQGYVRCGRCHNVFNALAALADDPARQAEPAATADTQRRPVLTTPEPQHPEAPPPEPARPDTTPGDPDATDTSLEFNPASTNINEVFIEAATEVGTGTFESIVLSGDDSPADPAEGDPVITPQALSAPADSVPVDPPVTVDVQRMRDALAEPDAVIASAPERVPPAPQVAPPEPAAVQDDPMVTAPGDAAPATDEGATIDEAAAREIASAIDAAPQEDAPELALLGSRYATARLPRGALQVSAAVLALCLLAQVVHHLRAELAATSLLHRPLTAIYQALGLPLAARWNISDYEIRQLGATTEGAAAGDLMVRASISNRATHDQPLPLLRVVMQDRFGNRVAGRDLRPAEYLGLGAPPVSLMAPGQRVDVQVAFQDPGQAATGFEIDACMTGAAHTVSCANDPGAH
jgi:predicted Zn finger-like uncharacterized protein